MDTLSFAKLLSCSSSFLLSLSWGAYAIPTHLHIPDVVLRQEEVGIRHNVRAKRFSPTREQGTNK